MSVAGRLAETMREVIRISDRKHIAWDAAKDALAAFEADKAQRIAGLQAQLKPGQFPAELRALAETAGGTYLPGGGYTFSEAALARFYVNTVLAVRK
jgi:hypothetical protein